mgnify:CR=1 FL=1
MLAARRERQRGHPEREEFVGRFEHHLEVATFLENWWPQLDPREVLLWLADPELVRRHARGTLRDDEVEPLAASFRLALETGTWSVADVALVDELAHTVTIYPSLSGSIAEAARQLMLHESS